MGYDPGSITCPIKVQLFWEGHKKCAIFLMVWMITKKMSKPWGRLRKFMWPSQKAELYLKVVLATFFSIDIFYLLHAMVWIILMVQIIQCFPPFSMNDSDKNLVFLTL